MKASLVSVFICVSILLSAQTQRAKIVTNYGAIEVMLYDGTPQHRDNFIKLVKEHYYDSLLFHRVIKNFVIQAGDPVSKNADDTAQLGDGDLGYTVPAEICPEKYFHKRGALGMARDDNPAKASSACQFYIVTGRVANDSILKKAKERTGGYEIPKEHKLVYQTSGGIPHLDSRYTVFGEVTEGMEVVDKISAVLTDKNDRPLKPVRIRTMVLLTEKPVYKGKKKKFKYANSRRMLNRK